MLAEVKIATVRSQVLLSLFEDFQLEDPTQVGTFVPREHQLAALERTLGELIQWSGALRGVREGTLVAGTSP